MPEGTDLLAAIEAAHAAALDETLWPDALAVLARVFGATGATLEDFAKQPLGVRYFRITGLPSQAETDYLAHYQYNNPRADYAFRNLSQPILCDYVLIDERGMDRHAYYAKYLTSLDLRYFISGQIMDAPDAQAVVSIQRSRRQGHVERSDIARMRRLLPHLRQAYDVSRRLRQSAGATRAFEHMLDWLADGVAAVRADGRIVHANEAFLALARRNDGIRMRSGVLEFATGRAGDQFAKAVAAVMRLRAGHVDTDAPVDFAVTRGNDGSNYLVSVRPLPRSGGIGEEAAAIVFVHDPHTRNPGMMPLMRGVFGFTEAEASLAEALRTGSSVGDYARARMLSLNTVYWHLRRIKEKTGCSRLPQLISKLNELRGPVRAIN
jgi:DNA-binding CsgD family transcriptional regulator/PAS domain-containing protein